MKRAGYEIIEDILLNLIKGDPKSAREIANQSDIEWHEVKIYLEFMTSWGLIERKEMGRRNKYALSTLTREYYILSIIKGEWIKNYANLINRLISLNRPEKAEYLLLNVLSRLFQLLEKKIIKEEDVLRNIGILFHSINYHSKLPSEIMDALALEELESHYVYIDKEVMKTTIKKIKERLSPIIIAHVLRNNRQKCKR